MKLRNYYILMASVVITLVTVDIFLGIDSAALVGLAIQLSVGLFIRDTSHLENEDSSSSEVIEPDTKG